MDRDNSVHLATQRIRIKSKIEGEQVSKRTTKEHRYVDGYTIEQRLQLEKDT